MKFDGNKFAREIETRVADKVQNLSSPPKIVSILVGDDPASELYTRLKSTAAERVGINFEIVKIESKNLQVESLKNAIERIGDRNDVAGVMVQLPIEGLQGLALQEVLSAIPLEKDVDGLRWEESGMMPATVKAILAILEKIADRKSAKHSTWQGLELWEQRFVVLGARGAVGRPLVHFLKARGVQVDEIEWDTLNPEKRILGSQVVISCVGKPEIVTGEMVSENVIAINVGMKEVNGKIVGDMAESVYQKASVAVRALGGVGPVTIACLMENGIEVKNG